MIEDHVALYGMIEGSARVAAGGILVLYGLISGDLHVERGGVADVRGMVAGALENEGTVVVAGVIQTATGSGGMNVRPGSTVNGIDH